MSNSSKYSASEEASASPAAYVDLFQMAIGHFVSRALYLVAKLGLADLLKDGPRDYRELANITETHAHSLKRVLRLLTSVGVFEELNDGEFALTPLGTKLRADVPNSRRAMVMLFAGDIIQDYWKELEYSVRTGEPSFKLTSAVTDPFSYLAQNPQRAARFDRTMATFAKGIAAAVTAVYDFSKFDKIADVGGGNGVFMIGLLEANPGLCGIVFDLPHVRKRAQEEIEAAGLGGRCEVIGGSFFDGIPRGADAYILKYVAHDWNDERVTAILKNCWTAMAPGGKLLVVENVYPAKVVQSPENLAVTGNDVNLLVSTGGRQRSEEEFRNLFEAAGFRLTRVVPTSKPVSVIEASKIA